MEIPPFDYTLYEENCGLEWKNWHRSFDWYLRANHIEEENEKFVKLMHLAGRKVQEVFETLPTPAIVNQVARGPLATGFVPQLSEYEVAVAKLNEFFEPKKNLTYERHQFRLIKQEKNEKIGIFAMRLRTQAEKCDFGTAIGDNIKDQIIEKCASPKLRRDLLKLGDTAQLEQVLKSAKIFEAIEETSKTLNENEPEPNFSEEKVNKIDFKYPPKRNLSFRDKQDECSRCGFTGHRSFDDKCPAKGKACNKCGGKDHFSRKCRSKKRIREFSKNAASKIKQDNDEPPAKSVKAEESSTVKMVDSNVKDEYIFCIGNETSNEIDVKIGGIALTVVVDSGSKYNIVDSKTWEFLKANKVTVANQRKDVSHAFKSYGGHALTALGIFEAKIETKFKSITADFVVVQDYGKVLIGYQTGVPLGVMKIGECVNSVEQKAEMSKIKGFLVDIPINPDVKPVAQPYRRVPVPLEEAVDRKIDELLEQGIIEKVNGPSEWISAMVPVPKADDVRICIDMRRANEAIQRENYPLPTMEDLLPHIGKGKFYTKLDVKNAFHQV